MLHFIIIIIYICVCVCNGLKNCVVAIMINTFILFFSDYIKLFSGFVLTYYIIIIILLLLLFWIFSKLKAYDEYSNLGWNPASAVAIKSNRIILKLQPHKNSIQWIIK